MHGKYLESDSKCYHTFEEEDMIFNRKEIVAFILKYKTMLVTKTQHNRFTDHLFKVYIGWIHFQKLMNVLLALPPFLRARADTLHICITWFHVVHCGWVGC